MARTPATPTIQETFHPPTPTVAPTAADYGFTDEQAEEFGGEEFIAAIAKISAAEAARELSGLKQDVLSLQETQTESTESAFYTLLTTLCPNWREINEDDRFEKWLEESDGLSGIPRKNFVTNAYDNRDAETAARYFIEFAGLLSPPSLDPAALQDIVPERAGGGLPPKTPAGNIYTPKGIAAFFKDKGLGKFKGREAEAAAIENDIFAAQQEGRIMLPGRGPRKLA